MISDLILSGYKFMFIPKRSRKKFLATRAIRKKDGTFNDDDLFDEFACDPEDMAEFNILPKGKFIDLRR